MSEVTEETRHDRLRKAIAEQDKEYLQQHEEGRDIALTSGDLPDDPSDALLDGFASGIESKATMEENDPELQGMRNRVFVGPHVLGGLEFIVIGSDGTKSSARVGIEQAIMFGKTLDMWLFSMMQQSAFEQAQALQTVQQEQKRPTMHVPRG